MYLHEKKNNNNKKRKNMKILGKQRIPNLQQYDNKANQRDGFNHQITFIFHKEPLDRKLASTY